jgi:hypothetical protein
MYLSGRISHEENLKIDVYITKRDNFFVPLFVVYHTFFLSLIPFFEGGISMANKKVKNKKISKNKKIYC